MLEDREPDDRTRQVSSALSAVGPQQEPVLSTSSPVASGTFQPQTSHEELDLGTVPAHETALPPPPPVLQEEDVIMRPSDSANVQTTPSVWHDVPPVAGGSKDVEETRAISQPCTTPNERSTPDDVPSSSSASIPGDTLEESRRRHAELLSHLQTLKANSHRDSERLEKLDREMQAMKRETRKSMDEIQESVRKIQETQWRAIQIKAENEEAATTASIPEIPHAPSPTPRAPSPSPTYDVQIGPMHWPVRMDDMRVSVDKLVRMVFPRAPHFEAHFAVCEDEERETGEADRLYVIIKWKEERDAIRFVNSWNTNTPEKYRGSRLTVEKLF